MLQSAGAVYLIFHITDYIAHDETSSGCALGKVGEISHSSYRVFIHFWSYFLIQYVLWLEGSWFA